MRHSLESMFRNGIYPTATARDFRSTKASAATMAKNSRPLSEVVGAQERGIYPTATRSDAKASGAAGYSTASGRHPGTTLTDAVRGIYATATSHPRTHSPRQVHHGAQLANQVGGFLNPAWVAWLMGFPTGWTDSPPSETP